jgi:hypothetical protein
MRKIGVALTSMVVSYILFAASFLSNEPPKTLIIGDSWALLAPIQGHKLAEGNADIDRIQQLLRLWPDTEYDQVLIVIGRAQIAHGATTQETERDIKRLAEVVRQKFGRRPIVANLKYMEKLLSNPEYTTDHNHLNVDGYALLFEHMGIAIDGHKLIDQTFAPPIALNRHCPSPIVVAESRSSRQHTHLP